MSILSRSLLATAVLGGLLLARLLLTGVSAHEADMFATMDANRDGRISMQEHDAAAKAMFTRMDADHDGRLTAAELHGGHRMMKPGEGTQHDMAGGADHPMDRGDMHRQMAAGMMARMDANHDGVLTAPEHAAAAEAMFAKMDVDHDGKVTSAEMATGEGMVMHEKRIVRRGPGMHAGAAHGDMLAMMDADHDGVVTEPEHALAARTMFTRADGNHDGYVTPDEMKAAHAAMASHAAEGNGADDTHADDEKAKDGT